MIDFIARGSLLSLHPLVLIIFLTLGLLSRYKPMFCRLLFILLFTLIFNPFLKSIWQIPLAPHLNKEGWAFPSGHMQLAVVFWGWLAIEFFKPWFGAFVLAWLFLFGFSLIHFHYHTLTDVLGAVLFASLSLLLYYFLCKSLAHKNLGLIGLIVILISFPLVYFNSKITPGIWLAEGGLLGFTLGCFLQRKQPKWRGLKIYAISIFTTLIGLGLIYLVFSLLKTTQDNPLMIFLQFLLTGIWLSYVAEKLIEHIMCIKKKN